MLYFLVILFRFPNVNDFVRSRQSALREEWAFGGLLGNVSKAGISQVETDHLHPDSHCVWVSHNDMNSARNLGMVFPVKAGTDVAKYMVS
jgi:hypothetical protein